MCPIESTLIKNDIREESKALPMRRNIFYEIGFLFFFNDFVLRPFFQVYENPKYMVILKNIIIGDIQNRASQSNLMCLWDAVVTGLEEGMMEEHNSVSEIM